MNDTLTHRQYDYDLMAALTKNTAGSLKKMWPPVKKKAMETHPSFAAFLGQAGTAAAANSDAKPAPALKAAAGRKRKATDENDGKNDLDPTSDGGKSDGNKSDTKKKVAPGKKAPAAKAKG